MSLMNPLSRTLTKALLFKPSYSSNSIAIITKPILRSTTHLSFYQHNYSTTSSPTSPPPSTPKKKSSPTALFYRNLLPSMLHCLALGSIIYYALELLHNFLDAELIKEELDLKIEGLERELEIVRAGVNEQAQKKKGWFW